MRRPLAVPDWNLKPKTFPALVPSPLARNAPEITMVAPDDWTANQPAQVAVYGKEDKPVVVSYQLGKGEVMWWASSSPLSNGSIRESGNLALFLNSVGPASESRVLWDEYFHGARGSLGSYFAETPLPWAAVQLGIVFLALLFTLSRRWGPLWVPVSDSRLSPLEFVDTLGDLYKSAHASPAAVGVAYQRLRSLLARKLETPAKDEAAGAVPRGEPPIRLARGCASRYTRALGASDAQPEIGRRGSAGTGTQPARLFGSSRAAPPPAARRNRHGNEGSGFGHARSQGICEGDCGANRSGWTSF